MMYKRRHTIKILVLWVWERAFQSVQAAFEVAKQEYESKVTVYEEAMAAYQVAKATYDQALEQYKQDSVRYRQAKAQYDKWIKQHILRPRHNMIKI